MDEIGLTIHYTVHGEAQYNRQHIQRHIILLGTGGGGFWSMSGILSLIWIVYIVIFPHLTAGLQ